MIVYLRSDDTGMLAFRRSLAGRCEEKGIFEMNIESLCLCVAILLMSQNFLKSENWNRIPVVVKSSDTVKIAREKMTNEIKEKLMAGTEVAPASKEIEVSLLVVVA
jgi:hypothetical protein